MIGFHHPVSVSIYQGAGRKDLTKQTDSRRKVQAFFRSYTKRRHKKKHSHRRDAGRLRRRRSSTRGRNREVYLHTRAGRQQDTGVTQGQSQTGKEQGGSKGGDNTREDMTIKIKQETETWLITSTHLTGHDSI